MDNNKKRVTVDRRDFLKLSGAGLSGLLLQSSDQVFASTPGEDDVAMRTNATAVVTALSSAPLACPT